MAPDPSNEPESDQSPLVTGGPLLLDDGRVVTPRHLGGTYTLCELLHRPDTREPATTRQGLDHRSSRPVGSLIPLPNKTLASAAPVDADPATGRARHSGRRL
ncbi:hypothetical protein AB0M79_30010 [Polymorphospora sp. NPDC051019]|uniref:hypothetical protein n=1 Tax=Polymorphospora sp. NPDC051019 TaxID=3155725 RepID=UPI00341EBFB6